MKTIMLAQATFNNKLYAFRAPRDYFDFVTVGGFQFAMLKGNKDFALNAEEMKLRVMRKGNINGRKVYVLADKMKDGTEYFVYVAHNAPNMTLEERLTTPNALNEGKTRLDDVCENLERARAMIVSPDVPFVTTRGQQGTVGDYV